MRCGYQPVDDDHERLAGMIDAVRALLHDGAAPSDVRRAFIHLSQIAAAHFRFEESIMRSHGYPDLDVHIADHEEIARHFDLLTGAVPGTPPDAAEAITFLDAWMHEHFEHRDAPAMRYVLEKISARKRA